MEHIDGISAARLIREHNRSVLFIYISGHDSYLKELFEVEPFQFLSNYWMRNGSVNLLKKHIFFKHDRLYRDKEMKQKISEDRQKEVHRQLCEIAKGKRLSNETIFNSSIESVPASFNLKEMQGCFLEKREYWVMYAGLSIIFISFLQIEHSGFRRRF